MGDMTAAEYLASTKRPTRNKYGAQKTTVDGVTFDSKGEADRWCDLRILERAGDIVDLRRQVTFPLKIGDVLVCKYIADFVYAIPGQEFVVEDFKGHRTDVYRLKAKLFLAVYGFPITETGRVTSLPHEGRIA